jgi:hypothetical protein
MEKTVGDITVPWPILESVEEGEGKEIMANRLTQHVRYESP